MRRLVMTIAPALLLASCDGFSRVSESTGDDASPGVSPNGGVGADGQLLTEMPYLITDGGYFARYIGRGTDQSMQNLRGWYFEDPDTKAEFMIQPDGVVEPAAYHDLGFSEPNCTGMMFVGQSTYGATRRSFAESYHYNGIPQRLQPDKLPDFVARLVGPEVLHEITSKRAGKCVSATTIKGNGLHVLSVPAVFELPLRMVGITEAPDGGPCCRKCKNTAATCGDVCIVEGNDCDDVPGCACVRFSLPFP